MGGDDTHDPQRFGDVTAIVCEPGPTASSCSSGDEGLNRLVPGQ
jgi:hypothetical protein